MAYAENEIGIETTFDAVIDTKEDEKNQDGNYAVYVNYVHGNDRVLGMIYWEKSNHLEGENKLKVK